MAKTKNTTDKKINLSFWERVTILMALPKESSFEGKIALTDLHKKLDFIQADIKKYKVNTDKATGAVTWSTEGAKKTFSYEFTALEEMQIKLGLSQSLTVLDEQKKVDDAWIELAKKFDAKPFPINEK